jgi:DNA-binding LacI/PurR family transcriptional regulator
VGLILPELTNPIFPAFAQVIETALVRHGFTPVLCTHTPGGVHEDDYVQMLLDRGVAGIIYISGQHADTTTDPSRYVRLRDRGLPIVLVNGYMPGVDAPFVSTDEDAAMELTLNHLTHLGHTTIGLAIGPARYVPAQRKIAAYRRYMSELLGVREVDELVETEMYTVEGGQAAAFRLIEKGCTALVCGSDLMALGAVRGVRSVGMRVPDDISVIGYDDSALMTCTDPPLTTVRQPIEAMGRAAVDLLASLIAGNEVAMEELLFEPELVVRASAAPARKRAAHIH